MNTRTHIAMDPEIQRRAEAKAAELGVSFAEYVRRLVATDLGERSGTVRERVPASAIFDLVDEDEPTGKLPVSSIFNLGASDEPTDIARDKDKLVGEAVWDDYLRSVGRKPRKRA